MQTTPQKGLAPKGVVREQRRGATRSLRQPEEMPQLAAPLSQSTERPLPSALRQRFREQSLSRMVFPRWVLGLLPSVAQELRTYLHGRKTGYLFESNRHTRYAPRTVQDIVKEAALAVAGRAIHG